MPRTVTFTQDRFLLFGGTYVAVSADATNWTRTVHEEEQASLNTVAFGNGRFVALGDYGGLAVSTNGEDWTFASLGSDLSIQQMRWAAGQFIAVGYGSPFGLFPDGVILSSPDGHEWSYHYHPAYRVGFYSIAATTEHVFVAGDSGTILESAPVDIELPHLSIRHHAAGGVVVNLNGQVGRSYRVESCSGLAGSATWQPLRSFTLSVPSESWVDTDWTNVPGRFFRAVLLP